MKILLTLGCSPKSIDSILPFLVSNQATNYLYIGFNEVKVKDSYPLPLYNLFFEQVKESNYIIKFDLKAAYNLVRIRKGYKYKTAIRIRQGQYKYSVMPFKLINAPAVF